ncbi:hypothetical protein [Pseudomonas sp. PDM13]|uniref:hypothetical protein n=1 Tax=Pseudomonas sp. PDM13 TaxID=2769255 RepID=UPI0021E0E23F|nr:hypothetical protein [Pseudomonas sp. PDM13]MCU9947093.1 hypothetical protein [Pseudomonas sp. PDM13]
MEKHGVSPNDVGDDIGETMQLRTSPVWLAWDLGDELTAEVNLKWNLDERRQKLQTNAAFLQLLPAIAVGLQASAESREKISAQLIAEATMPNLLMAVIIDVLYGN